MDTDYKFGEGKFRWIINESFVEHGSSLKQVGRREQLDWIKREIEYSMFAEKFKLRYELLKGEVYEIDFGININAEFSNRHFGVVIKNSNENNPLVLVCPLKQIIEELTQEAMLISGSLKTLELRIPL